MRPLTRVSVAVLFAAALFGQNRTATPVLTGGFGNAVFPAGTHANNPSVTRFTPNAVFPAGGGPHLNIPGQRPTHFTGTGGIAVPYPYPVYVGGSYDDAYGQQGAQQQQQQQPNVTVVYPPQPAPVIVNQFGPPREPDQRAMDSANSDPIGVYQPAQNDQPEPEHYLVALKDHTVYSVLAYWVDGDTLHYFTSGNIHNQVSLSLVDRSLTTRLNREAGNDVRLPAEVKAPGDKQQ